MIPELININNIWKVLPPGIHEATLEEVEKRFATNEKRKRLFDGFKRGVAALKVAGCKTIYLDGSFVSEKTYPGDFDACWDTAGVTADKIDPVLLEFSDARKQQKLKFYGEFFPSSFKADGKNTYLEFFQIDRHSGNPKGILCIHLHPEAEESL